MRTPRSLRRLLAAAVTLAVAAPLTALAGPAVAQDDPLEATVRRTTNGIPHVLADDWEDLGFGYAYAFAEDNICTAADFYVTVRGERSRFFGPDGTWTFHGNGTVNTNRESDFLYTALSESGRIEEILEQEPPHGPRPEIREAVRGYVAGYNHYLDEIGGPDGVTDPRCKGEEWVRPITEMDVYRRFYQLASLASLAVAIDEIGGAQPPTPDVGGGGGASMSDAERVTALEDAFAPGWLRIGSNAYGIGAEFTDNGHGMVLGNPHFPWQGGERLYQSHLKIPGELDVSGASLLGVPIVLIGHTAGVAWSHTVSTAFRFTPFELKLVPGSPTTYLVDGQPVEMERQEVAIQVLQEDGSVAEETRTLYSTIYGRVMTGILGLPIFPWTPATAFAMGDANDHMRYLNHFFEKNLAQSVRELYEVQKRNLGVPWVNTIAADKAGEAYYADISVVPNVPDEHVQQCASVLGRATFAALRLPVMDGSRSDCGWLTDEDAVAPGVFGPSNLPHLFRDDYTMNSNDSYWLSNHEEPLTGFDRIIGDEETARSLRTRLGFRIMLDRVAGGDEYAGTDWTQDILQSAVFNNRQYAGELTRDDVVEMCRSFPAGHAPSSQGPVPVDGACDALEGWDLRDDLDSTGAILFRRFWGRASAARPSPWRNGFDPEDPINTPNTLNTQHPQVQQAFGDAIHDLRGAGIPFDAPLGDWQYEIKEDGTKVPIHGGPGGVGVFNAINVRWDAQEGYPDVAHGSSFVMAVQFTEGPCPDANAIVTYSQSEDPTRPFNSDQTRMFSRKDWNDMHFCEDEIAADPNLEVTTVRSAAAPAPAAVTPPLPATGGGAVLFGLALLASVGGLRRRRS